jgi:hypothetical protein
MANGVSMRIAVAKRILPEPYGIVRKLSACKLQNTLYNVDIREKGTIKKRE